MREIQKIIGTVVAFSMLLAMPATAQRGAIQRPKPKAETSTSTSGQWGVVEVPIGDVLQMCDGNDYVFFRDFETVYALDKKTGEFVEWIKKNNSDDVLNGNIQAMAARGNEFYFYIQDAGIYRKTGNSHAEMIVSSKKFTRHFSSAYDAMIIDPTGDKLILYGTNENAVVVDIESQSLEVIYDRYTSQAYWYSGRLWSCWPNGIYALSRKGRVEDNTDALATDQSGTIKFVAPARPDTYEAHNGERMIFMGDRHSEIETCDFDARTGKIYAAVYENIYQISGDNFSLIASITGEDNWITHMANNGKVAIVSAIQPSFFIFDNGYLSKPRAMNGLKSDIAKPKMWDGQKELYYYEIISQCRDITTDKGGNFWLKESDNRYLVYNPDGIEGLPAIKGHLVTRNQY